VTTINVIAIDGPAASGKTTISQQLAERLGFLFLDTGTMYRAVTLAALRQGIVVGDETAVTQLAQQMNMEIVESRHPDGRHYTVLLDGQDVTWAIRTPEVEANVSQVSSYLGVREELVRRQQEVGKRGRVVMVGRDIGTVVMPDAPLKLYVIATAEERARRRWQDRQQQGFQDDYAAILADVERRDQIDSSREHSPLRPAADALIIDTTDKPVAEIVAEIVQLVKGEVNSEQ
jgi:cytidylate kinase